MDSLAAAAAAATIADAAEDLGASCTDDRTGACYYPKLHVLSNMHGYVLHCHMLCKTQMLLCCPVPSECFHMWQHAILTSL